MWDIVRVPFPYTNRPVQQRRPALVVARVGGGAGPALLWVLMVTSAANRGWLGDVVIEDGVAAGLGVASVVRTAKIATIDAEQAGRIGAPPVAAREAVRAAMRDVLAPGMAGE